MEKQHLFNIDQHQKFDPFASDNSPLECLIVLRFGIYILVVFLSSLYINTFLIIKLLKMKRKPMNKLVLAMTITNFVATIFHLPLLIGSHFSCR